MKTLVHYGPNDWSSTVITESAPYILPIEVTYAAKARALPSDTVTIEWHDFEHRDAFMAEWYRLAPAALVEHAACVFADCTGR